MSEVPIYTSIDFASESDVEQKLLYKIITYPYPYGLGYKDSIVLTKPNIKKVKIDKGTSTKYYFPDYVLYNQGLPSLIVEAKAPHEDLHEAFREARLYATEVNSSFPSKINPCSYLIVCNGNTLIAGHWDSEIPLFTINKDCYLINHVDFEAFLSKFSFNTIDSEYLNLVKHFRNETKYIKPRYMLGGAASKNITRGENSFGINLAIEFKYLFNPETEEEREAVIKNAYVESKRRLAHVLPIDRLIRNVVTPSTNESHEIIDTKKPTEIFNQLKQRHKIKNEICLLIGSVGSGKSTFIDYLHKKALPQDLTQNTFWLSVNLNTAPINEDLIYAWFAENALKQIAEKKSDLNFNDLNLIKRIFHEQIKAESSLLSLLGEGTPEYNAQLYNIIKSLKDNKELFLKSIIEYLFVSKNILPIIVLDNCDKKPRSQQLLMFDVANYIKTTFNVMVILPLRETTYDLYKNEPPLDTVIKDLVFRIDPPLLIDVIKKRIEYALREISSKQKDFSYTLTNGSFVVCKSQDVANYLRSILHTLFQNDFFRKLMIGITGRNIRKGLEIFLEFSKSGHLTEDIILKMRTSDNSVEVPNHLITRILLRGKKEYYEESSSRIKNIFHSEAADTIPDPFIRLSILSWLKERQRLPGPTKVKGYFKTNELERYLIAIGHIEQVIRREIEVLLEEGYLVSESQDSSYNEENLISITSAGVVILELLSNIDYLATISEDTFFKNVEMAQKIADNMSGKSSLSPMSKHASLVNASTLLKYLQLYKNESLLSPGISSETEENYIEITLDKTLNLIEKSKNNDLSFIDYDVLQSNYPVGSIHEGVIVSLQKYGVFVEMGLNATGLVHISQFEGESALNVLEKGDLIDVQVLAFHASKKKFDLGIVVEE